MDFGQGCGSAGGPAGEEGRRGLAAVLVAVLGGAAACGGCGGTPADPPERPNVLIVTLDTTRSDFLTPFGADPEVTPRLAELARRSRRFPNAVSETNITNPSHLSIFSGLRAIDHGVLTNDLPLPEGVDTLPELLRREGYRTAGFPAVPHLGPLMGWRGFEVLPDPPAPDVDAPDVARLAETWIRERAGEPFFCWVHFFDAHALYRPPEEIAARFYAGDPTAGQGPRLAEAEYFAALGDTGDPVAQWLGDVRDPAYPDAMYAAELHYADREVGRLLDLLDELDLTRRTLVVVLADHGESLGEHGIYYCHKGLYEPQVRIPLLFAGPGVEPGESRVFASTLDVAPTLEELLGVELADPPARAPGPAGRSLVPFLRGGADGPAEPSFFVHQNAHNHVVGVREGSWKLLLPLNRKHPVLNRGVQLFDLASDPDEQRDVADQHPERVEAMRARARPWLRMGLQLSGEGTHLNEEARERLRQLGYE